MRLERVTVEGYRAAAGSVIECRFPSRFTVLVGANGAGKTTVCDALYLAHRDHFPSLPRPHAAALGPGQRSIKVTYTAEPQDTYRIRGAVTRGASWERRLEIYGGRVRSTPHGQSGPLEAMTRLIYLPAHRNPIDQLAQREAWLLVELLRAERKRLTGRRGLHELRELADELIAGLTKHELIESVEERIRQHMAGLSDGVVPHFPFVGAQHVDDAFLARVLEMLMAPLTDARVDARRLELSGLGYVNLLHIAVILAAIPDRAPATLPAVWPPVPPRESELISDDDARAAADEETDTFFKDVELTTVIIEEPEAHLHPQLQYALVRRLQAITRNRPEIQVILSSHSPEIINSVKPEEIVLLRATPEGIVCRPLAEHPEAPKPGDTRARSDTFRKAAIHLDATRSASLFAERVAIVEGITDAILLRQFARLWALDDPQRTAFADTLTIFVSGAKTGGWPLRLLGAEGFELASRIAVLCDSDGQITAGGTPWTPSWHAQPTAWGTVHSAEGISRIAEPFVSEPTLEPAITWYNEPLVDELLTDLAPRAWPRATPDEPCTAERVHAFFQTSGKGRKAEFAAAFAERIDERIEDYLSGSGQSTPFIAIPAHIYDLLKYLYDAEPPACPYPDFAPASAETFSPDPAATAANSWGDGTYFPWNSDEPPF